MCEITHVIFDVDGLILGKNTVSELILRIALLLSLCRHRVSVLRMQKKACEQVWEDL